ncbi:MAG: helix-turn-helix domain-containing protein [Wenzhouxiangellaceae bacterium]
MNQQTKKQQRQSPADLLRKTRMAKKWSVDEVAKRLKLSVTTVKSLEKDGCPDNGDVYRRGYAINYAKLLGLDVNQFSEQLGSAITVDNTPPPAALTQAPRAHRAERLMRFATYALGTAVVAVPLVWSLTEGAANFFSSSRVLAEREAAGTDQNGQLTAQPPAPAVEAPQHMNASVAPIPGLGSSRNAPATPIEEPELPASPVAESEQPVLASNTSPSAAVDIDSILEQPAEAEALGTPKLQLSLQSDSWVEITDARGERLEYDLLLGGSTHSYQGAAPYRILIGRATGVELRHHGEIVDLAPFIRGNVASFELQPQAGQAAADHTSGAAPSDG